MNQLDDPILQALHAYKAAVFAKDVDQFVALYDQDVQVFDMWNVWSYNGIDDWREMTKRWFGSLGAERVIVDLFDMRTIDAHDLAVIHAFAKYKAVAADGEELRSLDNRLTLTLRRKDGAWKIVHLHTSAPIDLDTAKVIFRR